MSGKKFRFLKKMGRSGDRKQEIFLVRPKKKIVWTDLPTLSSSTLAAGNNQFFRWGLTHIICYWLNLEATCSVQFVCSFIRHCHSTQPTTPLVARAVFSGRIDTPHPTPSTSWCLARCGIVPTNTARCSSTQATARVSRYCSCHHNLHGELREVTCEKQEYIELLQPYRTHAPENIQKRRQIFNTLTLEVLCIRKSASQSRGGKLCMIAMHCCVGWLPWCHAHWLRNEKTRLSMPRTVAFEVFKLKSKQSEKQPFLCTFLPSLKG